MRARHPGWTNFRLARYFGAPVSELERLFPVLPKPTPAALRRHGQPKGMKMDNENALHNLADELDVPLTSLKTARNKWRAGKSPVSDKDRAAFAAFDAHPEIYGTRQQASAALPRDLTNRGADSFEKNLASDPRGENR
jgi:hypothetical protein